MNREKDFDVRIRYGKASDYRRVSVTGVCGGAIPSGGVLCDFFVEVPAHPEELHLKLEGIRPVAESPSYPEGEHYLRELQVGMILTPQVAKSIGQWMIKWAEKVSEGEMAAGFDTTRH